MALGGQFKSYRNSLHDSNPPGCSTLGWKAQGGRSSSYSFPAPSSLWLVGSRHISLRRGTLPVLDASPGNFEPHLDIWCHGRRPIIPTILPAINPSIVCSLGALYSQRIFHHLYIYISQYTHPHLSTFDAISQWQYCNIFLQTFT